MPNVEVVFKKKAYNASTDNGNGVVVFDTEENKIYVGGVCYSSDVKDASYSEGTLTIEKSDGTSFDVEISNSQPDWSQSDQSSPDYIKNKTHNVFFGAETTTNINSDDVWITEMENGIVHVGVFGLNIPLSSDDMDIITSIKINGIDAIVLNPYFYEIKEDLYAANDGGYGLRHGNLYLQELFFYGSNSHYFTDTGENYCIQTEDEGDEYIYFPASVFGNTLNTLEIKRRPITFCTKIPRLFLPEYKYSLANLEDVSFTYPIEEKQILQRVKLSRYVYTWRNVTPTYEDSTNKVTSLSAQSTDTQYPSAKCVYDLIGSIDAALDAILNGSN